MQHKAEVADIIIAAKSQLPTLALPVHHQKTLRALSYCRTAKLGGHKDACTDCGTVHISYNSCRNRHCPKCQGHKRQQWMQARTNELLPVPYFHVVFTLPSELNSLCLHQPKIIYDALFKSAWDTVAQFFNTTKLKGGMVCILHTWGQNLSLHPHLHCIVPGGGLDNNNNFKHLKGKGKYLFCVKALSKVYRAKYMANLRDHSKIEQALADQLFNKDWIVYAKRPFGSNASVIEYLGRYTHKVAISNARIKSVTNQQVVFDYKDYKQGGTKKAMALTPIEFTRRFASHILPQRFVRIRHYGILSSTWKRNKLKDLQKQLNVKIATKPIQTKLHKCPHCKTGTLITIEIFGTRGPPPQHLNEKTTIACNA